MRGLDSALNLPLCCPAQLRDQFFALVDTMFKKLSQRSQDPEDSLFNKFPWDSLGLVPPSQIYNMDEMGVDTNKSRKKKAAKKEAATDLRQHARLFEETYGDNNPFHVTGCLTTCADGSRSTALLASCASTRRVCLFFQHMRLFKLN